MSERPRVVILGGGGFIGSHLAEDLVGAGYPVRVFDKSNAYWGNVAPLLERIELREGDFVNQVDLRDALDGCAVAIHLVSATLPATSNENPIYDVEANVVGTLRLLDEARRAGTQRLLFISSGGTVYGRPRRVPIPEDHPTEPLCSYGIGKLAIEKYLALYQHLHGLRSTVLRFANPFGERQNPGAHQGAVAVFLGRVLAGLPIEIWGDGEVMRDYIYIKDAVTAFRRVLETDPPGAVFNVGSGRGTTLNQLIERIERVTGRSVAVARRPGRALDVPVNVLDTTRLREATGWEPAWSMDEGLLRTWRWLVAAYGQNPAGPAVGESAAARPGDDGLSDGAPAGGAGGDRA